MIFIINYTISVLKNVYLMPRPFFIFETIQGMTCSPEYGSPSGHGIYLYIFIKNLILIINF
jgi:hypothetical protein